MIDRVVSSASERYRSILDALLDAVICVDAAGRIVDWNVRAATMFGRKPDEVAGEHLAATFLVGDDGDRLTRAIERFHENPGDSAIGKRMAMRGRHRTGREFAIELTLTPIDVAGDLHFAVFVRDYSSRQNQGKRRERQALETQLLQHAALLVAQADTFEDAVRNSLKVMCEITGWQVGHAWIPDRKRQRLVTKGIWHGIDEQKHQNIINEMQDISFARGEGLPGGIWERREAMWIRDISRDPTFIRRGLGERLGVKGVFGFPVTADDEVEGVIEFFSEEELTPEPQLLLFVGSVGNELGRILERRRWDEERSRLAAIVDSSLDAIIGKTLDGTIISWNEGATHTYGYTAEEAIGQTTSIILPVGVMGEEAELRNAVRTGHRLVQFETRRRNKNGRLLDVSLTISPIRDSRGRVVGSSTIERDITTRKARERELVQARRDAEASLRAKSEFLANISHELRTPMNAIIGMIDLVMGEDLSPLTRDYLETAQDSSRVMLSLVNDLLDFSRIEAGKLELDNQPFNLRRMFDEAMRALSLRACERGLEFAGQVNRDVPDRLDGDGRRLRQVIMNLAGNAIKFTEQGEVTVCIAVAERDRDDVLLRVSVADTGIGISTEDQQEIFKPFTQVDSSSTRKHTGTGLGLTICREVIDRMGGRISLESEVGRGSTFSFTVRFRVLEERGSDIEARVSELRDLPVLIVDDNATNRRILTETLANWSLAPEAAECASQALEMVRRARDQEQPFPLLIIDALMPEVDGFSLVESLQAEGETEAATVLMLSSADRQTFEDRCQELDIDAFVEKPVSESLLLDAIMTALGGPQADQEAVQRIQMNPRALRVLLVEDTPANQKVVCAILQKRGHEVTLAHNGREAVERQTRDDFDVILMDVQMPTMDGYQASRAVRELEDPARSSVPIIAMTAHALAGDRLRCLQAGMDGYLSKPVDGQELIRLVERFGDRRRQTTGAGECSESSESVGHPSPTDATEQEDTLILSLENPLKRLGGDVGLLRDTATFLVEDAPRLVNKVTSASQAGDLCEAMQAAHSLKGLASSFDAARAQEAASHIEDAANRADVDEVRRRLDHLDAAFRELIAAIHRQVLN